MRIKTSRRDMNTMISVLTNLISASAKDFSKQISFSDFFPISLITNESKFEQNFYLICVYLCSSFLEQSVSDTIAIKTLKESLRSYRHKESYMNFLYQSELEADLSFIAAIEQSVIRTPVMSDLGYYNELCLFAILQSRTEDSGQYKNVDIFHVSNSSLGQKLNLWVSKTIHEISITYDCAMNIIKNSRKKGLFESGIAFVIIALSVPIIWGIISGINSNRRDNFSDAYVAGYNAGAEEGARCGIEWSYTAFDKTVPNVDYASVINEYSFYSFPLQEYYE